MTLDIRFGTSGDITSIAQYVLQAGDGVFEQLFEGLLPGMGARDLVRVAVADEGSPLNYSNALLIEENDAIVACAIAYPAEEYGLPPVVRSMLPAKRLAPLGALFSSRIGGSYYVNTLAVDEKVRGRGLARLLLETICGVAEESGATSLSLHAWSDNESAMRLYTSFGFSVVGEIPIQQTRHLRHSRPMVLLQAPVPLPPSDRGAA